MTPNNKKWGWMIIVGAAVTIVLTILGLVFSAGGSKVGIERDVTALQDTDVRQDICIEKLEVESIQQGRKLVEIGTKLDMVQQDTTQILDYLTKGSGRNEP